MPYVDPDWQKLDLFNDDEIDFRGVQPISDKAKYRPLAVDDPFMVAAYDCDDQTAPIPTPATNTITVKRLPKNVDLDPVSAFLKQAETYIDRSKQNMTEQKLTVNGSMTDEERTWVKETIARIKKEKESNSEITTNDRGGRQSKIESNFHLMHLLPEYCYQIVFSILAAGAIKYGLDNWMKIDTTDHINHAIRHLRLFLAGDTTENHLGNACCRCLFALYTANHNE